MFGFCFSVNCRRSVSGTDLGPFKLYNSIVCVCTVKKGGGFRCVGYGYVAFIILVIVRLWLSTLDGVILVF